MEIGTENYIGYVCPYCKTEFGAADDIVLCSKCQVPHHKACWEKNEGCTTFCCPGVMQQLKRPDHAASSGPRFYCPGCGAVNEADNAFCPRCGRALSQAKESLQPQSPQSAPRPAQEAYRHGAFLPGQSGAADDFSVDEALFIRTNVHYYIRKFNALRDADTKVSWNWAAGLFGAYWCFYRKMYLVGGIYVTVGLIAILSGIFGSLLSLAAAVTTGILGNYLYMKQVDGELHFARSLADDEKRRYLARRGGTSPGAALGVMGALVLLGLILSFQGIVL